MAALRECSKKYVKKMSENSHFLESFHGGIFWSNVTGGEKKLVILTLS